MKNYILALFVCGAVTILSGTSAVAECSVTDPCAPKKVKDAWQKSLAFGFNLTSGNSDTRLMTILSSFSKETDESLSDVNLSYNYGEDKNLVNEDGDNTTRNDIKIDAAYNTKFDTDWYAGFGTKYVHDEIADIDYRVNLNPTLGYFAIKNSDASLALEVGPGYTYEHVASVKNNYFSPRIADRFEWIISCTSKVFQKAELLLDTENSQNYLVNAEVGLEAAISSKLSLVVALKNAYDHTPAPDKESNDVQMISALKVAL